MSLYVLALVTLLATNDPDIKVNMSVKFSSKEACNMFISTYYYQLHHQLTVLFPKIQIRKIMCIDSESIKELQKELYGNKT